MDPGAAPHTRYHAPMKLLDLLRWPLRTLPPLPPGAVLQRGGHRRAGDTPFLPEDDLFWWIPRLIRLALTLAVLGWLLRRFL